MNYYEFTLNYDETIEIILRRILSDNKNINLSFYFKLFL